MAIDLATQYLDKVDELFAKESRKHLLTNQDFSWDGAHTVKVYRVSTVSMNDYGRAGASAHGAATALWRGLTPPHKP